MSSTEQRPDRTSWTFLYTNAAIASAAKREAEYHRRRESWWLNEAAKTEAEIRATGVSIKELAQTGGPRFEAQIDLPLGVRLNEARQKVDYHRRQAEDFEAWVAALGTVPSRSRDLTFGDVCYFRLGFADRPEEPAA